MDIRVIIGDLPHPRVPARSFHGSNIQVKLVIRQTACTMDCPDTCVLEVAVRDGRLESVEASRLADGEAGFICSKVRHFARRQHSELRVRHPLKRRGPKGEPRFERISWDEALDEIRQRMEATRREWGGEAILPYHYGGSNGFLTDGLADHVYFARLGASRLRKTICAAPATAVADGMYGKMPGVAFEDYALADCIVIWGANPRASNIHLVPFLREAKARGAFIATVDPRRNLPANEVDLHLAVKPGTDLPVALAMLNYWHEAGRVEWDFVSRHTRGSDRLLLAAKEWSVERAAAIADVDPGQIVRLAGEYARRAPAVIRVGWGVERNANGGRAIAAILAMPAMLGKFGVRGGGYTLSNNGAARFDRARVYGDLEWNTRELNMTRLGEILNDRALDPPVKSLFIYNSNPVATAPDQNKVIRGLMRDDLFTVVAEQVMTDTTAFADIVLPATTFLEHHDIRESYGAYVTAGNGPVLPPVGEARSNARIFSELAGRSGFQDPVFRLTDAELFERTSRAIIRLGHQEAPTLHAHTVARYDFPGETPVQMLTVSPLTCDGKINLFPEVLGSRGYSFKEQEGGFPLALVTPADAGLISSTFGETNVSTLRVTLNPSDALSRGIEDDAVVRVFNELGEVICRARISEKVRKGVASMPKGAWRRSSINGNTSTALCPASVSDVAGGACFNDARVEVEQLSDGA